MKFFFQYVRLETKRMFLFFPRILLGSLLLCTLLAGILMLCQKNSTQDKQKSTVRIGICAKKDEPFVDWMISAVSNMKNMEYNCHFERVEPENVNRMLVSGEITIAFFIPENYVASIVNGENKHLSIRMGTGQATIVSFLLKQLSEAASSFILNSEAGIYSMQEYYDLHRLPQKEKDELELNLQYIKDITELEKGVRTETIQKDDALDVPSSHYIISGFVLMLLLFGLTTGRMLAPPSKAFEGQLLKAGISTKEQLFARGLAFFAINITNYLILFLIVNLGIKCTGHTMPDILISDTAGLWKFAFLCLPLLLFSTAVIQLVYEITADTTSGMVFLFFNVLILALCSGCFYPLDILPDTLQKLAPKLPIYQACRYGLAVLHQTFDLTALLTLTGYFILCFLIMAACRTLRRIRP